jgi:hypothetical protein
LQGTGFPLLAERTTTIIICNDKKAEKVRYGRPGLSNIRVRQLLPAVQTEIAIDLKYLGKRGFAANAVVDIERIYF